MAKQKKVIRSKYMYKKRSHKGRNTVLFILLIVLLVGLGYILSREWSKRFGSDADLSSFPQSSEESSRNESDNISNETSSEPAMPVSVKAKLLPQVDMTKPAGELRELFQSYKDDGYGGVYIELKTSDGMVTFDTANEMAMQYGAVSAQPVALDNILSAAEDVGLIPIARISALKDPLAPHVSRSNSYAYENDTQYNWLDNEASLGGKPWLNPYMENARKYISDLCAEAASRGFELIILENVNFPTTPYYSRMGTIQETTTRAGILDQLLEECQSAAGAVPVISVVNPVDTVLYDMEGRGFADVMAEREYADIAPLLNLDEFRNNALTIRDKLGLSSTVATGEELVLAELDAALKQFAPEKLIVVREADWALIESRINTENLLYTIFI